MSDDLIFVFDHTIFNDIYREYEDGEKDCQKYARFIQDYLIIRKALARTKMIVVTSKEVFERIVNRTQINPKTPFPPNIWIALNDLVDVSNFTYSNSNIFYKESVIILSVDLSFKYPSSNVILLSNSDKTPQKVLTLYAKYGRPLRTIDELPFKIMNCEELLSFLKENDSSFFKTISEMLKKNYDFLEEI